MRSKVLFVDRDGTLIEEPGDFQVDSISKVRLVSGVMPALLELQRHGYRLVMITNQDGLGTDAFPQDQFDTAHQFLMDLFTSQGITFDNVFICPHLPHDNCECRKPRTGLLTRFLASTDIDMVQSAVVGDRQTDLELADRIGVRGLLVNVPEKNAISWQQVVELLCYSDRIATVTRKTNETDIECGINLDSATMLEVSTGIGFYDHMLEQLAKHGNFGLRMQCAGDLHIDEHHTVEDTAICLGSALREALGNKYGIGRYGYLLPMDESEAKVSLDLSGRAAFNFIADFPRDDIGELSTEMVEHFFRSLSDSLKASLHIDVRGKNTHHMIEACFKSVGRALGQAITKTGTDLPSTKGVL